MQRIRKRLPHQEGVVFAIPLTMLAHLPFGKMLPRQVGLDLPLSLHQPVQRAIRRIFVYNTHPQFLGYGGGVPSPDGGQCGPGMEKAFGDQNDDEFSAFFGPFLCGTSV